MLCGDFEDIDIRVLCETYQDAMALGDKMINTPNSGTFLGMPAELFIVAAFDVVPDRDGAMLLVHVITPKMVHPTQREIERMYGKPCPPSGH